MAEKTMCKVKVAVRVRPLNRREAELNTTCVVRMEGDQTIIHHPNESEGKSPKTFAFDHCFWSCTEADSHFASQEKVFESLGLDILENAFQGYNACIFAYGQTGSGKSYTMMGGSPDQKGVIPRLCDTLFERIQQQERSNLIYKVEVSYMEIYNEKVRDLLDPKGTKHSLRVREHNILGPYVDGLSTLAVSSFEQILSLMEEGNKSRTVAATNMNSESSRSHAVFNIRLTQTLIDEESGITGEKMSRMSLVDLAGSERAQKSGAVGERLKEGSNINKSLTTLGLVISALADQSTAKTKKFVPYRDSVLTWLLKDNLGGNSKTVMVATISPAADNYEESLSTLRYADRAKRIVNHAMVNEDPNARIIRELREEVEALRAMLKEAKEAGDLRDRLAESERLVANMSVSWEERLQQTERIHQERQRFLEQMGIDVQASGIKVQQGKFYLVNLNADPSMNEMLVYYLKERTLIGRPDAPVHQDIQLKGLGIQPQHAVVTVENGELYVQPQKDARTCVNGIEISAKTPLQHGDRVVWGNNHFFRVNCPGQQAQNPMEVIDYEKAREEVLRNQIFNDPIEKVMQSLEKQHEDDKQAALEKQREMYEEKLRVLKTQMTPVTTPMTPGFVPSTPSGLPTFYGANRNILVQEKFLEWAQERDEMFKKGLAKLREEIVRANAMAKEASLMAEEMTRLTEFHVTLQIPAANLTPSKIRKGAFVSEPAILVRRKGKNSQIWSMEKLENKLVDMREMYEEWKETGIEPELLADAVDPFYESQENHNLIGVANVFLEVLFHDVKLDYHVPIISQQGEVAGRLHVEIYRTHPKHAIGEEFEENNNNSSLYGQQITCRVKIRKAANLPPSLANFVFCQYRFWGQPDPVVVAPAYDSVENPSMGRKETQQGVTFVFDHEQDYVVNVSDEFLEYVQEEALSVQVWGHKSAGFGSTPTKGAESDLDVQNLNAAKTRSLQDRWAEVIRRLEMWVEIHELSDEGEYAPVEVQKAPEVPCAGVFQLRQGQQKRIVVKVEPLQTGNLPLVVQRIQSISIGCICPRCRSLQKGLDSYQEEDLTVVKERWSDALAKRQEYLYDQIQSLMQKPDKTESDSERENALIVEWLGMNEERAAVLVPTPNSGVPGAPADWSPPEGMEKHIPVLFLDLNAEDMAQAALAAECLQTAGINSILPKEHGSKMFQLPILRFDEAEMAAVASWDSSIHEHISLNRVTPENERVYAVLKVIVRISHPAEMELVLRKRLCFNIIKSKVGFAQRLMRKVMGTGQLHRSGVIYEIVANIPKATEDVEARETLALIAARGEDQAPDGETYIEKYTRGIAQVESILVLDRLRQEVAIKELLTKQRKGPKKSTSLPEGFNNPKRRSLDESSRVVKAPPQRPIRRSLPHSHSSNTISEHTKPTRPTFLNLTQSFCTSPVAANVNSASTNLNLKLTTPLNPVKEEEPQKPDEPPPKSATHESLAHAAMIGASLTSSGYGSQTVSGAQSEDSLHSPMLIVAEPEPTVSPADTETTMSQSAYSVGALLSPRGAENIMEHSMYSDYGARMLPNDMQSSMISMGSGGAGDAMHASRDSLLDVSEQFSQTSSTSGDSQEQMAVPDWLRVGCTVVVQPGNQPATVQYIGQTEFAQGVWVGVVMEPGKGENDGTVNGVTYFSAVENRGLFVRPDKVDKMTSVRK